MSTSAHQPAPAWTEVPGTRLQSCNLGSTALSRADALAWIADHRAELEQRIDLHGGVLLRGMNTLRTAEDFDAAISLVAPEQRDYVGGTSPRTVVHRRIMTATDTPRGWSIALHQEMAYTATPPDRIAFFCASPATQGGQTTVGDMREVLSRISPEFRAQCERYGLQLRRAIPSAATAHLKPGFQKDWSEVFGTTDHDEVERIVAGKGWRCSWLDDDTVQVWQDLLPPVRRHPVTGDEAWSNFAHFFSPICMMTWALEDGRVTDYEALARARQETPHMLDAMYFGNGEPVPEEESLHVFRLLRQAEIPLELQTSDLMILDNIHYAHGRRAFDGTREIYVSLYDLPSRTTRGALGVSLRDSECG